MQSQNCNDFVLRFTRSVLRRLCERDSWNKLKLHLNSANNYHQYFALLHSLWQGFSTFFSQGHNFLVEFYYQSYNLQVNIKFTNSNWRHLQSFFKAPSLHLICNPLLYNVHQKKPSKIGLHKTYLTCKQNVGEIDTRLVEWFHTRIAGIFPVEWIFIKISFNCPLFSVLKTIFTISYAIVTVDPMQRIQIVFG